MFKKMRPGCVALFIFLCIAAGYFTVKSAIWTYDEYAYWKLLGGGN